MLALHNEIWAHARGVLYSDYIIRIIWGFCKQVTNSRKSYIFYICTCLNTIRLHIYRWIRCFGFLYINFLLLWFLFQANFTDEDYYDDEEIPEAEIRLEAVMDRTRAFLAAGDASEGLQLLKDSFRKGFITLVCPDRFTPNSLMSKCGML